MKRALVFTFHRPFDVREFSFFEIGESNSYFPISDSKEALTQCVKPLQTLLKKIEANNLKASILFSGTYIEALSSNFPLLLEDVNSLRKEGKIEILGGTYHQSMAPCFSQSLFTFECEQHKKAVKIHFNCSPTTFINSLNTYSDEIGKTIDSLGYKNLVTEANSWHLYGRNSDSIYAANFISNLKLILRESGNSTNDSTEYKTIIFNGYGNNYYLNIEDASKIIEVENTVLVSSLSKGIKSGSIPTYRVPRPIGFQSDDTNIDSLLSSPLQRTIIEKILELENKITISKKDNLIGDLAVFASQELLEKLNPSKYQKNAHQNFLSFINMLADLEIRINS